MMRDVLRYLVLIFVAAILFAGYSLAQPDAATVGRVVGSAVPAVDSDARTGYCGNGIIEKGEECEEGDLNGKRCETYGFIGGSLSCKGCIIDTSDCIAPTVPAGQLYNRTSEGPGLKLDPVSIAVLAAIMIIIIGGMLYFRFT